MPATKEEIYIALLTRIESGKCRAGCKMLTERELAAEFDTPQWRVHLAINKLEENGFVERRRAAGTFVRKDISLDKVSRKKNKTSNKVVVSVSKDFYFQVENYHDIIGDLERGLEADGCDVTYYVFPESSDGLKTFLKDFANDAKAVIIFPEQKEWNVIHKNTDLLMDYPGNIFYFNRGRGPDYVFPFNSVALDFYGSGICAGRWVFSKGFNNVAYFTKPIDAYWARERYSGFKESLSKYGLEHALFSNKSIEELYDPVAKYIKSCDSIPAIVCVNDQIASKVSYQMRVEGLTLGKDFVLVGFDNHPKYRAEKLVSIAWPLDKFGEIIADCVSKIDEDKFHDLRVNKCLIAPIIFDRVNFKGVK